MDNGGTALRNGFHRTVENIYPGRGMSPDSEFMMDLDSERDALAGLLSSTEAADIVVASTEVETFTDPKYRLVRLAAENLHQSNHRIDVVSVANELRRLDRLEGRNGIGGEDLLISMMDGIPHSFLTQSHCDRIVECWRRRRVWEKASLIRDQAERPTADIDELESKLSICDSRGTALFPIVTADELASGEYEVEYLIDGLLVRGQNCILAGPKKALKTNLAIALALRLSIGGHVFNGEAFERFHVPKGVRVMLMSGESGAATIQETAARIARSMGWSLNRMENVLFCFNLPNLADAKQLNTLERMIQEQQIEVLILDPAYLMIPAADFAGNLFAMGSLLLGLNQMAQRTGVTTILLHHLRKGNQAMDTSKPPELEDIAWAGFQEFARQWILIGRRTQYDPERGGHHELWLNFGGSAGHSGLIALDIDEGTRQDPHGRGWSVVPMFPDRARARAAEEAVEAQEETHDRRFDAKRSLSRNRILKALEGYPEGRTFREIRDSSKVNTEPARELLQDLQEEGLIESIQINKNHRTYTGYRLNGMTGINDRDNTYPGERGSGMGYYPPLGGVSQSHPTPTAASGINTQRDEFIPLDDRKGSPLDAFPMDLPEHGGAPYTGEETQGEF